MQSLKPSRPGDVVISFLRTFSLLLVTLFILSSLGCANRQVVKRGSPGSYSDPERLMLSAAQYEQKGDLYRALMEYRIARTLSVDSNKPAREVNRLEKLIAQKTDKLMSIAEKKYARGKLQSAEVLYFKILTLDPNYRAAFDRLRDINKKQLHRKMKQKVALSQRYRKSSHRKKNRQPEDEGYTYSRQAILQAENRAKDVGGYIAELEKHITKYPSDTELKEMLVNVRIVQARASFGDSDYDRSLSHLAAAEGLFNNDEKFLKKLSDARKEFAKELYLRGLRSVRSEPGNAIELWKRALKFDPDDKRTQLRIDTFEKRQAQ
ncbi:MAG: hypothetical protein AB2688_17470 [Candidatus Thiodiazotropha taylori]|nr:hypothetical protein [Candidatus Thiodiazotropha taylori]MCG8055103.1 hypothetical protein [Candidatus Thiodiazotropha taylori]MCW4313593.1 hypothetical protein [Candidatus Thiodiazotropha taylori]MCW4316931.1 hypothetical protein [Candidatus Thiodiazotropha taylori]